jgi:hypothetical protein
MMNIGDLPAMPTKVYSGLTKREMFCLHNDIAGTGDAELDEIIKKGNKQKFAMAAMKGILSNHGLIDDASTASLEWVAKRAASVADALLAELEKTK